MASSALAFYPGYRVSVALGLFCFEWPDEKREAVYHRAYSALLLISLSTLSLAALLSLEIERLTVDVLVTRMQTGFYAITIATLAVNSQIQTGPARRMILIIGHADILLQNSALKILRPKLKYLLITYIGTWTVILLSLLLNSASKRIMIVPYMLSVLIIIIFEYNIVAMNMTITQRFEYINSELTELKGLNNDIWAIKLKNNVFSKRVLNVVRLRKAHADLCDVIRDLDATCRGPMVPLLATHFFIVVGGLYFLFMFATRGALVENVVFIRRFTTFAGMTLFSVIRVILVTYTCNETVAEARRTGEVLYRLEWLEDIKQELRQFAGQLQLERIHITCGGMFDIDLSLLYIIGGAITSYLVILIQFQSVSSSA